MLLFPVRCRITVIRIPDTPEIYQLNWHSGASDGRAGSEGGLHRARCLRGVSVTSNSLWRPSKRMDGGYLYFYGWGDILRRAGMNRWQHIATSCLTSRSKMLPNTTTLSRRTGKHYLVCQEHSYSDYSNALSKNTLAFSPVSLKERVNEISEISTLPF